MTDDGLAGQRVLVTGGTRGMGAAIAGLLTKRSARVVVTARHPDGVSHHRRVPLGRPGTASEVARLVAFLVCDEAPYITGAEFVIDGGNTRIL